ANAVKAYLFSKKIAGERLITDGFGSTKPIADNKTAKGKALNRRVEFRVQE
ncbi:OmpA family protein, partial [Shewanella algae]|uniref:OmpA family protein n=2 Tax=Bacteria TaxID=2 RepID=UPI003CC7A089